MTNQEANQAPPPTPPSFIVSAIEDTKKAAKANEQIKDTDDMIMARGADSDFWKILKRFIVGFQISLHENTTQAVKDSGFRLEEAGLRYILSDQLAHALQEVVSFVETRKEVVGQMAKDQEAMEQAENPQPQNEQK